MKFVSYGEFGQERAGFLHAGKIVDLEKAMRARGMQNPASDMRIFLERAGWKQELAALQASHRDDQAIETAAGLLAPGLPIATAELPLTEERMPWPSTVGCTLNTRE